MLQIANTPPILAHNHQIFTNYLCFQNFEFIQLNIIHTVGGTWYCNVIIYTQLTCNEKK